MFPIIDVARWVLEQSETIGTKEKTWLIDPFDEAIRWLVKWNRTPPGAPPQGEDWSEKIAAALANRLGLPHATVELALGAEGRLGIISKSFVDDPDRVGLTHGNELMARFQHDYPADGCRDNRCYTVENVAKVLSESPGVSPIGVPSRTPPPTPYPVGVSDALDVFVGYLLLDALIGNGDRHHQNWAVLEIQRLPGEPGRIELAPTFDHATSLGRELPDTKRRGRTDRDDDAGQGSIKQYVGRCRSPFFLPDGSRVLTVSEAFVQMSQFRPSAAAAWLTRLDTLGSDIVTSIINEVPCERMSAEARLFAHRLVSYTSAQLLR